MPKFDERIARQYRCEPPPEFPLASPYSGIVHHLSGLNRCAPLKPLSEDRGRSLVKEHLPTAHFHFACGFATHILAQLLNSLVRVSRRVVRDHLRQRFASGSSAELCTRTVCCMQRPASRTQSCAGFSRSSPSVGPIMSVRVSSPRPQKGDQSPRR